MAMRKSDLYSSLWASCDELRSGRDASQYKDRWPRRFGRMRHAGYKLRNTQKGRLDRSTAEQPVAADGSLRGSAEPER